MSQLFDYMVCSRPMIEEWADALEQEDDDLQQTIEAKMPRIINLRNVGQDDVNILAHCINGDDVDAVKAVREVDLVKAISEEAGPWVMALRNSAVEAIASMTVNPPLLQRWANAVAQFNGRDEALCRECLTTEAAESLKEICRCAVVEQLGLFTCFYG